MLIKEIMRKNGTVDENTVTVTCPHCNAAELVNSITKENITSLYHDENCLFVKTCRHMKLSPYGDDEKVLAYIKHHFEVKKLFE